MKQTLTLSLLLATLALAACGSASNRTGETLADIVRNQRGIQGTPKCVAPADLVGKPNTELAKMKFEGPIRVIYPGSTVNDDQISNRLNFKVDKKGVIREITCG